MKTRRLAWLAVPFRSPCTWQPAAGGNTGSSASNPVTIGIGEPQHLVPSNTVESNGSQVIIALCTPAGHVRRPGAPVMAGGRLDHHHRQEGLDGRSQGGWTFHNGEQVTSDSYINAWNYGAYGPNAQLGTDFFERIAGYDDLQSAERKHPPKATELSGLKKVDDPTFTVTLSAPFTEFEPMLGYNVFYPLPNAAFAADGMLNQDFEDRPRSVHGPFKMKGTWQHNQSIEVTKYAAFPGTKPKVADIDFKIYQDQDTDVRRPAGGQPRRAAADPVGEAGHRRDRPGRPVQEDARRRTSASHVPDLRPGATTPTSARRSRWRSTGRRSSTRSSRARTRRPPRSSPRSCRATGDNTCGDACKYNPAEAKKLYTRPAACRVTRSQLFYNADGGHKDWVDAVCNQLKEPGRASASARRRRSSPTCSPRPRRTAGRGLLRGAGSFDYPSMEDYLGPLYTTEAPSNYYGYSNPEFDKLVQEGLSAKDQAGRDQGVPGGRGHPRQGHAGDPAAVRAEHLRLLDQGQERRHGPVRQRRRDQARHAART